MHVGYIAGLCLSVLKGRCRNQWPVPPVAHLALRRLRSIHDICLLSVGLQMPLIGVYQIGLYNSALSSLLCCHIQLNNAYFICIADDMWYGSPLG
jgi:hypothetical protein